MKDIAMAKKKLIYLYTHINWYRLSLFKSLSKYVDLKVIILNGKKMSYEGIEYNPDYGDLDILILSEEESKIGNLKKVIKSENADAIVVPSMNSTYTIKATTSLSRFCSRLGMKVTYFWEYWPVERDRLYPSRWVKQCVRSVATRFNKKYIDTFLVPSFNTGFFYKKMGITSRKLVRCVNASELEIPETEIDVRQKLGISKTDKVVLFFGRLEAYKGAQELIEAFKLTSNTDWHLVICGPDEEPYKELVATDKRIHLLGPINPQERYFYYSAADLFALPNTNKRKIEAWGLTVNEAMSCGLPVLATEGTGSGMDLVLPGVNGYLLNSERLVSELKQYIELVLSNDELRKSLSENSLRIIKNYTFENMAKAFVTAIQ